MNQITQLISSALNIEDIISEFVHLKPVSRGFVGLCPFHDEDTPSFHVYSDTQTYYCFGCKKAGNIFTFIMESMNLSFSEALHILADRAGIKLQNSPSPRSNDILKLSHAFFSSHIFNVNVALAYLHKRGLNDSDIKAFELGYAPDSWDSLTLYLRKKGFNDSEISSSGLVMQSQRGFYDRFRGRIIFPIHDISGRTIAFGGRIIVGEAPKYINSPETSLYQKRNNLYLMDLAKEAIRAKKRSILCEGYMDAIRLHKSGFKESVASLGTSLTPQQAKLLSRYADRCYICYDSDTAGKGAAIRGMYILQASGLDVYVMSIPEGKDPDEYLLTHEPEEFSELIRTAKPLVLAHLDFLRSRLSDPLTHKTALKELFESFSTISPSEVLEYKSEISEATRIIPSELEHKIIIGARLKPEETTESLTDERSKKGSPEGRDDSLECALCTMLMRDEIYRLNITSEDIMTLIETPEIREIGLSILNSEPSLLELQWTETCDTEKFGILERGKTLCSQMRGLDDREKFKSIYSSLKRTQIERDLSRLNGLPIGERDMRTLMELYRERERYQK